MALWFEIQMSRTIRKRFYSSDSRFIHLELINCMKHKIQEDEYRLSSDKYKVFVEWNCRFYIQESRDALGGK